MLLVCGFCFVWVEARKVINLLALRVFIVGTLILVSPVVSLRMGECGFYSLSMVSTHNQQFVNL
jgi:hypothetical protein